MGFKLVGVAHAIPDVSTFVLPVFADDAGDVYLQRANGTTIVDFDPVDLGEEYKEICFDGQEVDFNPYRSIGDEALFGFSPMRHRYLIGNGVGLSRSLMDRLVRRREDYLSTITEPTREAVKRFFLHIRLSKDSERQIQGQVSGLYEKLNKTALIVDDSHFFRSFTRIALERMGIVCITAVDGVDAFNTLGGWKPDFVFLDLDMPNMHGHRFTKEFRKQRKFDHIPIVIVTTMKAERHRKLATYNGAQHFVDKPCTELTLFRAVDSLLEGWQLTPSRFLMPSVPTGLSFKNADSGTYHSLAR